MSSRARSPSPGGRSSAGSFRGARAASGRKPALAEPVPLGVVKGGVPRPSVAEKLRDARVAAERQRRVAGHLEPLHHRPGPGACVRDRLPLAPRDDVPEDDERQTREEKEEEDAADDGEPDLPLERVASHGRSLPESGRSGAR